MNRVTGFLSFILFFSIIREQKPLPDYSLVLDQQPSAIGTTEDPQARAHYENKLLADPSTGLIPIDIREKELRFAEQLLSNQRRAGQHQRAMAQEYELAGPFNVGGRTRAISLDIRDENTILAGGVSGGIWKTTNGGTDWKRTSNPALRNSVTALNQDLRPGKQDIWYAGTGELVGNSARSIAAPYRGAGLFKSTDGGESWEVLPATIDNATPDQFSSQFQYIWAIETNPSNLSADEVLVAAYGAILKSSDGGMTWEVALGQKLFDLPEETDLNESNAPFYTSLRKTPSGYFFATLSSASSSNDLSPSAGFYFSADGTQWQAITPPGLAQFHERTVIGIAPDESKVYFLTQGEETSLWKLNVAHIQNGILSGSWTDLTNNIPALGGEYGDFESQGGYNMLIEVHPQNPNVMFIGGTNLYRSSDGFSSSKNTQWIGGYSPENDASVYPGHYPDQHALLFYPSDAKRMISANDGGIRLTTNVLADSVSWKSLNNGYLTSQFYTIAQRADKDTDEILGGMQDNGSYLRDALGENPSWNRILGGDGGYCAISPNRDFVYVSFQNSQIYRLSLSSNYQLKSFARVDPIGGGEREGQGYLFINPFILDPTNASRMFLTGGDVIWRNENLLQIPGGNQKKTSVNWTEIKDTQQASGLYTALDKARDQDILYAGIYSQSPTIAKVEYASDATRETVTFMSPSIFPENGHIACISVNPENADHVIIIFSNYGIPSVFMTTDGGASFSDISGNLEENPDGSGSGPSIRWAEIVPTTVGISVFVGTSTGLYSTTATNGDQTVWIKESEGKIGNAVITMMDYRDIDGRLVIATHGNGTFQAFLEDARLFTNQVSPGEKLVSPQNFPNPFTRETTITYSLPQDGEVKIDLYDASGKLIRNLIWGPQYAGENRTIWDGTNNSGTRLKPGIYTYVLQFQGQQISKRIIYLPN
ncbi:FlgD immunoglobulin-like domain containing protein [Marinoscillum sp.]|uniref:FlgD immunoglobulin-like domain containing protein n=1 Tax=Marinoscillum sp. TaxID=2024838 RepID=UPI003BA9E018